MKKFNQVLLLGLFAIVLSFPAINAQDMSVHIYRRVAPENMQEYLKRETTYWQKFAESEIKKGNMTFWAVFQKVGGINLEESPNIMIINSFKDLDTEINWAGIADLFPNVKMEDIETGGLAVNTDQIFVQDLPNHTQVDNPDFNYVRIIYHNVKNANRHLTIESEQWKPMLQKAMKEGKTTMQGWGNGVILAPESRFFPYSTYSYDLFSSLQAALSPAFSDDFSVSQEFMDAMTENNNGPRSATVYRIVAAATGGGE